MANLGPLLDQCYELRRIQAEKKLATQFSIQITVFNRFDRAQSDSVISVSI